MKAIVFGAAGQDGIYLTELLKQENIEVVPVFRESSGSLIHSYEKVSALIQDHNPGFIFHLAADSSTSHEVWQANHETISTGTLNILEAVKKFSPKTKVFLSGSGLQFENKGEPIKETDPFSATSPYAVSRIHSVYAARYYRSLGIKAYVGYFFNHDSPLRTERHINKKIAEAAKRIASGSSEKLEIGDLKVRKEFGYAGDVVRAMYTMINQENVFEAVIGTGKAYSIENWIEICFARLGLNWKDHILPLQGFRSEYRILVSNPSTINLLGWRAETDINSLAKLMCS